jgi:N-methylhydantoinase B/oxoprolinase/acetone carboxylase alpha subunit
MCSILNIILSWNNTSYPEKNLKVLKQQILKNQSMVNELKKLWDDKENPTFINIMEKYFEK